MAEPAAGLLSPRGLARFSTPFVRRVVEAAQDPTFAVVLHNCGAKLVHLETILESGAAIYHFGAPMDLPAALARSEGRVVICGNVDPTFVHAGPPSAVRAEARRLLDACEGAGNPAFRALVWLRPAAGHALRECRGAVRRRGRDGAANAAAETDAAPTSELRPAARRLDPTP